MSVSPSPRFVPLFYLLVVHVLLHYEPSFPAWKSRGRCQQRSHEKLSDYKLRFGAKNRVKNWFFSVNKTELFFQFLSCSKQKNIIVSVHKLYIMQRFPWRLLSQTYREITYSSPPRPSLPQRCQLRSTITIIISRKIFVYVQ